MVLIVSLKSYRYSISVMIFISVRGFYGFIFVSKFNLILLSISNNSMTSNVSHCHIQLFRSHLAFQIASASTDATLKEKLDNAEEIAEYAPLGGLSYYSTQLLTSLMTTLTRERVLVYAYI